MRLPEEEEERGMGTPVIGSIAAVSVLILIILAVVYMSNMPKSPDRNQAQKTPAPSEDMTGINGEDTDAGMAKGDSGDVESLYRENKLRAEDLDFWDMYRDKETEIVEASPTPSPEPSPSHEPTDEELEKDGKHILISYKDGTKQWLEINEDIPAHEYDFTKMKSVNGKMHYYEGNKRMSRLGVELSEENGIVDFKALKEAGIDFVMLRAGSRGYETGMLSADESFSTNMEKAVEAGLEIGVYFSSQAVTEAEAVQEAGLVISALAAHPITYPVAFRMDSIMNDTARTDILDAEEKTEIAEAFLTELENAGYSVVIYGEKEWLLTQIEEDELKDRDIWLCEQTPIPEYPYQFKMWEYEGGQKIAGVQGNVNLTISFVDYTRR
jgi:GH25 family lysozyme M1 (1,4-beta-N-acetylmuramidase)